MPNNLLVIDFAINYDAKSVNQPTQQTIRLLCNTVQTDCNPKFQALQSVMVHKDEIISAKDRGVTTFKSPIERVFLPARTWRVQAGTECHNYVSICVCVCVRCYLLILLQSFQCRGGIISDLCSLCRSQSLGTSHSMILSPSSPPPPPPPPPSPHS